MTSSIIIHIHCLSQLYDHMNPKMFKQVGSCSRSKQLCMEEAGTHSNAHSTCLLHHLVALWAYDWDR